MDGALTAYLQVIDARLPLAQASLDELGIRGRRAPAFIKSFAFLPSRDEWLRYFMRDGVISLKTAAASSEVESQRFSCAVRSALSHGSRIRRRLLLRLAVLPTLKMLFTTSRIHQMFLIVFNPKVPSLTIQHTV